MNKTTLKLLIGILVLLAILSLLVNKVFGDHIGDNLIYERQDIELGYLPPAYTPALGYNTLAHAPIRRNNNIWWTFIGSPLARCEGIVDHERYGADYLGVTNAYTQYYLPHSLSYMNGGNITISNFPAPLTYAVYLTYKSRYSAVLDFSFDEQNSVHRIEPASFNWGVVGPYFVNIMDGTFKMYIEPSNVNIVALEFFKREAENELPLVEFSYQLTGIDSEVPDVVFECYPLEVNHELAKVEWYSETNLVFTSEAEPWNYVFVPEVEGLYPISAKVYNTIGLSSTNHPLIELEVKKISP